MSLVPSPWIDLGKDNYVLFREEDGFARTAETVVFLQTNEKNESFLIDDLTVGCQVVLNPKHEYKEYRTEKVTELMSPKKFKVGEKTYLLIEL